jgi:hypothetical protein
METKTKNQNPKPTTFSGPTYTMTYLHHISNTHTIIKTLTCDLGDFQLLLENWDPDTTLISLTLQ